MLERPGGQRELQAPAKISQMTSETTMPIGTVSHSGPRPKPRAVSGEEQPGGDREAGELEQQHLRDQPADDPERSGRRPAPRARENRRARRRRTSRRRARPGTAAIDVGKGRRADAGIAAARPRMLRGVPGDHRRQRRRAAAAMTSAARSGRRCVAGEPSARSLHEADVLQDAVGRVDVGRRAGP